MPEPAVPGAGSSGEALSLRLGLEATGEAVTSLRLPTFSAMAEARASSERHALATHSNWSSSGVAEKEAEGCTCAAWGVGGGGWGDQGRVTKTMGG